MADQIRSLAYPESLGTVIQGWQHLQSLFLRGLLDRSRGLSSFQAQITRLGNVAWVVGKCDLESEESKGCPSSKGAIAFAHG